MITREQAANIASRVVCAVPGDADTRNWKLVEFDAGWLIQELAAADPALRGSVTRVVERATGRVMRFPCSVPPGRILRDYASVVPRGQIEQPGT